VLFRDLPRANAARMGNQILHASHVRAKNRGMFPGYDG